MSALPAPRPHAHDAVVQGYGGTLTVENRQVGEASEPGEGATFTLALPAP